MIENHNAQIWHWPSIYHDPINCSASHDHLNSSHAILCFFIWTKSCLLSPSIKTSNLISEILSEKSNKTSATLSSRSHRTSLQKVKDSGGVRLCQSLHLLRFWLNCSRYILRRMCVFEPLLLPVPCVTFKGSSEVRWSCLSSSLKEEWHLIVP